MTSLEARIVEDVRSVKELWIQDCLPSIGELTCQLEALPYKRESQRVNHPNKPTMTKER